MSKEEYVIKCPHCGAEYLPAEIFYPEFILGNPENIVKDEQGHIEHFDGDALSFIEEYTCDICGHTFTVAGTVTFVAKEKKEDFDEEWTTTVFEGRIPLEESK